MTRLITGLPNRLSVARVWLALAALNAIHWDLYSSALLLVIGAVATDMLDGAAARATDQVSHFGDKLDHFADLTLLCVLYVALAIKPGLAVPMPVWVASAVVGHAGFQVIAWLLQSLLVRRPGIAPTPRTSYGKIIFSSQVLTAGLVILANIASLPTMFVHAAVVGTGVATIVHFAIDSLLLTSPQVSLEDD